MKGFLLGSLCVPVALGGMAAFAASTAPLTFDDLAAPAAYGSAVPNGYGSLQWGNFAYLDGTDFGASGYQNGVVSGKNVAFNGSGNPAQFSSELFFDLQSAWLASAWNDGLQLVVQGFSGGRLAYDNTYTLSATAPSLITFDYLHVNEVLFTSFGGTNHGYDGSGTEFVMDDLTVVVPEPHALFPWILGAFIAFRFGIQRGR